MYLDKELDDQTRRSVEEHLGKCRSCRQEMARLQLLWLELGPADEAEIPAAWPYLRQQIVSQAMRSRSNNQNSLEGYWEAQKLAWEPAMVGASYFPGAVLLSSVRNATSRQIPKLKSGTVALVRRLITTAPKGGNG